jgi:pilus assembly protein Flp/PilA
MTIFLKTFIRDESGATAIEYAIIAAVISIGIISGATALKTSMNNKMTAVGTSITGAF